MKLCKLLLATVGATVLLGALVGSASAGTIGSSHQTLRATFNTVTFNGPFGNIRCPVTLAGSLHSRTIVKSPGSLIGFINGATLGSCEAGRATILRETLPWHVRYLGFGGTLPDIAEVRINVVRAAFQVNQLANCLATSTPERPANGTFTVSGGVITTATISGTVPTNCGNNGTFTSSAGAVTTGAGTTTRITVTLI